MKYRVPKNGLVVPSLRIADQRPSLKAQTLGAGQLCIQVEKFEEILEIRRVLTRDRKVPPVLDQQLLDLLSPEISATHLILYFRQPPSHSPS